MKATFRRGLVLSLAALTLATVGRAAEWDGPPETLRVDLTGDGRPATISRRQIGKDTELGTFYQLLVTAADGRVLWRSPELLDVQHPMVFGSFDFGVTLPEIAGDIDGDGTVEMLVPAPQSDVSPTFFRVFRWTGNAFEPQFSRALTGPGRAGAEFAWTEKPRTGDFWVGHWLRASAEGWVVQLVALPSGDRVLTGTAVLVPKAGRFQMLRWLEAPAGPTPAAADPPPAPRAPAGAINGYQARLSAQDHYNSAGVPLTRLGDILRQDRANVHRGLHRDPEDQVDSRFGAAAAREAFGALRIRVVGGQAAVNRILQGTPVVRVTFAGDGAQVEILSD